MPATTASQSAPSRRTLLLGGAAGLAALVVSGCTGGGTDTDPSPSPTPDPDADASSVAAERVRTLRDTYDATIAAHPGLAPRLASFRSRTDQHVTLLGSLTPAPTPTGSASPSPSPVAVPAAPAAAVAALADLETRTADANRAALAPVSPSLARALASIAACESAHAALLRSPA